MRTTVILGANLAIGVAGLTWVLSRYGAQAMALLARDPSLPLLAGFVLAVLAGFAAMAVRWQVLLRALDCRLATGVLLGARAAGHSVSSLVPSAKLGGEPLRAWLAVRHGVPAARSIASVAADRALDVGASWMFALVFATLLAQQGIPALRGAQVTVGAAAVGLVAGLVLTVRRLRRGQGLLTAVAQGAGLDRFALVRRRMQTLAAAETALLALTRQRARVAGAFAIGLAANLVVVLEYWLLLAAFGLPATPVAVAAAIFATGASHSMPVPGGVGVLEGGQMWLFTMLGYPPDVGLAVGLAVRLREILWALPGLGYLGARLLRASEAPPHARLAQNAAARKPG